MGERICSLLLDNIKSPVVFEKETIAFKDTFKHDMIKPASASKQSVKKSPNNDSITVLLIDEATSVAGLSKLLTNFYSREKINVNIKKMAPEKEFAFIGEYMNSGRDDIDVFLMDIPWIRYFASKKYLARLDDMVYASDMVMDHFIPGIGEPFGMCRMPTYPLKRRLTVCSKDRKSVV